MAHLKPGGGGAYLTIIPDNYLDVENKCILSPTQGCFPSGEMYYIETGVPYVIMDNVQRYKWRLKNGFLILADPWTANCDGIGGNTSALKTVCSTYQIDINGWKKPNTFGKDVFLFYLTKYGIIPTGTNDDTYYSWPSGYARGFGRTAWIIMNNNMDYLHCTGLSWGGKTSCN